MIEVKELRRSFGPIVAVDGISFEVEKGQVLGRQDHRYENAGLLSNS